MRASARDFYLLMAGPLAMLLVLGAAMALAPGASPFTLYSQPTRMCQKKVTIP